MYYIVNKWGLRRKGILSVSNEYFLELRAIEYIIHINNNNK